jgi:pilus assembly protein CpaC
LPRLPGAPAPLGATPRPTEKEQAEFGKYVREFIDPANTLDMIVGRLRLMLLKETPKRIQIGDERIAIYNLVHERELTIVGRQVGTTVLNLWFADAADKTKEKVLSYLVRVLPDPEAKERLEKVYQALEVEINRAFPNSFIHVSLIGDKVAVCGQAHDIFEATQILRVVRANVTPGEDAARIPISNLNLTVQPGDLSAPGGTPGLDSFITAGGPNVINLIRVPGEQQVMLRVVVAEINRTAARSLGVNFSIRNNEGTLVFGQLTGSSIGNSLGSLGFTTGISNGSTTSTLNPNLLASLDNGRVNVAISALRELNYARSLAEPVLTTLNGQEATFQAGGEFPVPIVTGYTQSGLQGVNFVPYGVQLRFTPFVTDKDRIRLNVRAEVSTRDVAGGANINGTGVPGLNTRNFQTTVELREGQTLAVAGLLQTNLGADAARIPFLGDLPVVGKLFGLDHSSYGEQELVVLVTPELVHPMDKHEVPPLPGSDVFEPSDVEFYILGRLESRRSMDFRSAVRTDCARQKAYYRCEDTYIFGPHGHCDTNNKQPHD